jgi:hypothetical protein
MKIDTVKVLKGGGLLLSVLGMIVTAKADSLANQKILAELVEKAMNK